MPPPNVSYKVEVAFSSTWRTAAGSRVWTDVSAWVEGAQGIQITYGRRDERTVADANTATLTLDNSDGRFTVGNASSPYFPNIKIGRPVRITATVGGVDYVRFVGFVNKWPTAWPGGSGTYSSATISASSRLAWLGRSAPVANILDTVVTSGTKPAAYYWPAIDAAGATSVGEYQSRAPMTITRPSVQIGYNDSAIQLADGRPGVRLFNVVSGDSEGRIEATLPTALSLAIGSSVTALAFYRLAAPSVAADILPFLSLRDQSGNALTGISMATPGYSVKPEAQSGTNSLAIRVTRLTSTTASAEILLNGSSILSFPSTPISAAVTGVGAIALSTPSSLTEYRETVAGRVALFPFSLTDAELVDLTAGVVSSFSGETFSARLTRSAQYLGIAGETSFSGTAQVALGGIGQGEVKLVDVLRRAESSEVGVLYDNRTGSLTGVARGGRYTAATALTIDATTQRVGSDYSPVVDDSQLVNIASAKNATNTVQVTYADATSRTDYGDYGASIDTDAISPDEPYARATWLVNAYDQPAPRAPSLTTDVAHWIGDGSLAALLGLDIGSKVGVSNLPSQAPSTSPTYFVEGYAETLLPGSWRIAFNLSPTTAEDAVLVLDSGTRGLLDTNTLAL